MATDDAATAGDKTITFHVKSSDAKYTMSLSLETTTMQLKEKLSQPDYANIPTSSLRLIYSGRVLKDPDTLATYNIKEGNTMHLVKSAASNQRQTPASSDSATPQSQPTARVPNNLATGPGNNPLAGLTGARYAGFAQLPGAEMFGPDGGMGPPPSEEDMIRMLSDPQFNSILNEALQNPQWVDMIIQQDPQLRAIGPQARMVLQSDQFRRIITDPQTLRRVSEVQRAMGRDPFGRGAGGSNPAFPMPGTTNTTPGDNANESGQNNGGNVSGPNPPNTTGLTGATGGMNAENPLAALLNPAFQAGSPPPNTEGGNNQQPGSTPPNPLSFLFNPAMMGQQPQGNEGSGNNSSTPPQTNPFQNNPFQAFAEALGGMGGPPASTDSRPPAERYAGQLQQLNDMGFFDFDRNIQALTRSGGHVGGAVEYLLTQP